MNAPIRVLPDGYRKRLVLLRLTWGITPILVMWCLYLARVFWQWDPLRFLTHDRKAQSSEVYLWAAAVMTVFAPALLWRLTGHSVHLYQYGVEVAGRVTDFGIFRAHGMTPVTYRYEWSGTTYTRKEDMSTDDVKKYRADPTISLVIDPNNPTIARKRDTVFGAWLVTGSRK